MCVERTASKIIRVYSYHFVTARTDILCVIAHCLRCIPRCYYEHPSSSYSRSDSTQPRPGRARFPYRAVSRGCRQNSGLRFFRPALRARNSSASSNLSVSSDCGLVVIVVITTIDEKWAARRPCTICVHCFYFSICLPVCMV